MTKLYELSGALADVLNELHDNEGELVGDLEARLDAAEAAFADKIDACLSVRSGLDADAKALREEEKRLAARRKSLEAAGERLREYVAACMRVAGQKKIKTSRYTATLAIGKPRVVIEAGADVPDEYVRIKREPDKASIATALERGDELAFARLEVSESLRVR